MIKVSSVIKTFYENYKSTLKIFKLTYSKVEFKTLCTVTRTRLGSCEESKGITVNQMCDTMYYKIFKLVCAL
jgi:predicted metal-dependent hydrolase